ncbi:MAG TPA: coenzyme F420-0:L-glutamate ligase [Patescibacteria group bacterium]|nr:coenzyme F420-0:L-glutamate ligase [Patescibacteria group bacterium]
MSAVELKPVRTRIVTPQNNIVDVIEQYAKDDVEPGDVVCVAESVVAITQGRLTRPEDLTVCFLARILNRFIPQAGSMSSVYGMQAVMDVEGKWRVLWAMLVGALAKLVGKDGVFYQMAGRQAALVDDVTGTMPPFDKHIVYGPSNASQVAEEIRQRLGCFGAAVTDVNDLKRALVVGITPGVDGPTLCRILIDNPFGNASQKTPIVIIKNYAATAGEAAK